MKEPCLQLALVICQKKHRLQIMGKANLTIYTKHLSIQSKTFGKVKGEKRHLLLEGPFYVSVCK